MIKGKKILVTGGCGFIGSNMVEELHETNDVVVLDDLSTGYRHNLDGLKVSLIEGSITDIDKVHEASEGIDYVFHLAALPSVPRSVADPLTSNEINITGTLNVLMAAKECGVKKLVFASSSAVYGDSPIQPKVEDMFPEPLSPYAVNKLTGEYYCQVFNDLYGLPTTSVRYFNVYGPRQDPDSEYAAVIPKFISMMKDGTPPTIYGDGEQTRDFTYVRDTVQGTIRAAIMPSVDGMVVNIASGKSITLNELVEVLSRIMKSETESSYTPSREGDIKHSQADISKARDMAYAPAYDTESGLREMLNAINGEGQAQ